VDYSSVAVIEALGVARFRELVLTLRPSVTFANEQEAELVGPLPPPPAGPAVSVVKLGAGGCLVDGQRHPARLVEAVDTTGAGDAFAAGWLLGGTALALHAARRCVTRLGAMP
jgi:sugar/nucleoside kinase (ribokinase family)